MKVVAGDPRLECTLNELWDEFWCHMPDLGETLLDIEMDLRGESIAKPKFRIPSADRRSDVFFDNHELLCRFASMPTPSQSHFLRSIRQALLKNNVSQMVITIRWSKNGARKLLVRGTGMQEANGFNVLDFELLG